jgi:hypothetical protein
MDFQALGNIGEFVGAIAVVISLIYLAVQVSQNTASQQAENYTRALNRISALQSHLAQNGKYAMMFSRGVVDTTSLTPEERIQITWIFYEMFGAFEFMFHAAEHNAMPVEVWNRWVSTIAFWLRYPGVLAWWEVRPTPFTDSFTSFVESLIRDNPAGDDTGLAWQEFING